jgi:DNA repair protein RadD
MLLDQHGAFPPPLPHQVLALHQTAESLAQHKNISVMVPTGGGKTLIGLRIASKALKRGKRATFVCDRTALIEQTSEAADSYGLSDHGVIQQDHPRQDWSRPLQIASIQSVMSRGWPPTDVLIVDECHTRHKEWLKKAEDENVRVIGLSATPFTAGLGKVFSKLVCPTTMHELTQSGWLVPLRVLSCRRPNMEGAATKRSGEWTDEEVENRGMAIIGDVVAEWLQHGEGRKTIVFGATIAHCEELCRQFNEAGILAATYTEKTHSSERPKLLREFRKPDSLIRVLISVEALAKGFDVRDVGCVVDCRPLRKSLSMAIQMWGRGVRSSPETGKKDCILLDHSGNIIRFAADFENIYFNGLKELDQGEALDKQVRHEPKGDEERKGCPKCGYKPFRQRCMACGHEVRAMSSIVHESGSMQEVVIGKTKLADSKRDLWQQICSFARETSWVKNKGGYSFHAFSEICGHGPEGLGRFDYVPDAPVSNALRSRLEGKRKSFMIAKRAEHRRGVEAAAA